MVELMPPCGMKVLNLQMTPSERSEGHRGRVGNPSPIGLLAQKGKSLWLSHLPHVMTKLKGGEAIFYDTENGYPSWALAVGRCWNKKHTPWLGGNAVQTYPTWKYAFMRCWKRKSGCGAGCAMWLQVCEAHKPKRFRERSPDVQFATVWILVFSMWRELHVERAEEGVGFFSFSFYFFIFSKFSVMIM